MIRQDFYSGEPVDLGSPSFSAESEAENMASFGKYDYNSTSRGFQQPFTNQPYFQQPIYGQQMVGIGAPFFNQQTMYSPYGNPQPMWRQFPNQQFQVQPPQPSIYHIPGFNPSGNEFLPFPGWEDTIENLQMEYWLARQEVDIKAEMDTQQSVYGNNMYGYNYYGMPYYNPYKYNSVDNEYAQKLNKIKEEARQNRINFNIQLSKLAHNILGDGVTEEEIIERCTGKDIPMPQPVYQDTQSYWNQVRIDNLVPFDNSSYYNNARKNHLREIRDILPEDATLEETFKNLGILAAKYELEEEDHRRKDLSNSYSSENNIYKYYVRRKAKERYAAEHSMENVQNQFNNFGNQLFNGGLPTLSQNATIADDGTLNVSLSLPVNVGSHKGEVYTVANQNQNEYDKKREQFGRFLDTIKGDIYLDELKRKKFESSTFI